MNEDSPMNEKDFTRYKASLDASVIVATAKLFFFNESWKEISKQDMVGRQPEKDLEMVRRHLREAIASMDDTLFFFPPGEIQGKDVYDSYERNLKQVFEKKEFRDKIQAEYRRVAAEDPTLSRYSRDNP